MEMQDDEKSKEQLIRELEAMRREIIDLEKGNKMIIREQKEPDEEIFVKNKILQEYKRIYAHQKMAIIIYIILFIPTLILFVTDSFLSLVYFFIVAGGFIAFSLYNWRCPNCGVFMRYQRNPYYCRICGTQLRN